MIGAGLLTIYSMKRRKEKPDLIVRDSLPFGFNAMTVPPVGVFVARCQLNNKELLSHELVHWEQYSRMGLIPFYLGYVIQLAKFGYDKSPMEREARRNENKYCRENYTEAVRSGAAKTVFNPGFRK